MVVQEEFVGSDVVVNHDPFIRDSEEHLRNRGTYRKMEYDNIGRRAKFRVFPEILCIFRHTGFVKPGEYLGPIPFLLKGFLNLQHFIGYGVSVCKGRGKLMNFHYFSFSS